MDSRVVPPHPPSSPFFPSSLLFMQHRLLIQSAGVFSGLSWTLSGLQIVLGPPCLRSNLGTSAARSTATRPPSFQPPPPFQLLINPLYPDSDVIKGRASEPFMSVISHSLAVCLTSVPPVAPGSVSINHKQRSGQKAGDEEMELYILNGNRWDCACACVRVCAFVPVLIKKKKTHLMHDCGGSLLGQANSVPQTMSRSSLSL